MPNPTGPIRLTPVGPGLDLGGGRTTNRAPISRIERAEDVWVEDEASRQLQAQQDRAALPDVAAMTEVAEAPHGRRVARPADTRAGRTGPPPSADPLSHDPDVPSSPARAPHGILTTRPRRDRRAR